MVTVAVIAVVLGWLMSSLSLAKLEKRIALEINREYDGFRLTDSSTGLLCGTGLSGVARRNPTNPIDQLLSRIWPATFERVTEVGIWGQRYDNKTLETVQRFPNLCSLTINRTSITQTAVSEFRKKHPGVKIKYLASTFVMPDKDSEDSLLESINHW